MSEENGLPSVVDELVGATGSNTSEKRPKASSFDYEQANGVPDLDKSGAWLQSIADDIADYIYLKDSKSRFVFANAIIARDFGYSSPAELFGKTDHDVFAKDVADGFLTDEHEILSTGEAKVDYEEFVKYENGVQRWLSTSKFPLKTPEGKIVGILGLARDITERKKLETLRVGQTRVLEMIAKGANEAKVLEGIVHLIEEQLDGVLGSILLLDNSGKHLLMGAAPSLPDFYNEAVHGLEIGPEVGSCGTAAFLGKSVVVSDIQTDTLWANFVELADQAGLRSCWSTPFFSKTGHVLGTFALYNRQVGEPSPKERRLVEEATRLASIAIEKMRADREVLHLAHHDMLTALPNRLKFKEKLDSLLVRCRNKNEQLALVFVDLDQFKVVNDSFGHSIGDEVLKIIAKRLKTLSSKADSVFRFGGDEFVILVENESVNKDALVPFLVDLRKSLSEAILVHGRTFHVTASLGVACFPDDGTDAETLVGRADSAMYKAKDAGRDVFKFYTPSMSQGLAQRLTLLEEMRVGLETGEFRLVYQPQLDIINGQMIGAEALVRWEHPYLGTLLPGRFIPLMEDTDLICQLGDWVLSQACQDAKNWNELSDCDRPVGVNVSARQFSDEDFVCRVNKALSESGLRPDLLELEITESLLFRNKDQAAEVMTELRNLGVQLAIDDFGTGYSSLSRLRSFPLTRLKIDKSFISDLDRESGDQCIAKAIISLGNDLGLRVIAEGVETVAQQKILMDMGCREAQGFHFGRPMKLSDLKSNYLPKSISPLANGSI